ncbi:MAG: hypothetical protein ACREM8_13260 [Vulcanimicrobiaceae bacterium]
MSEHHDPEIGTGDDAPPASDHRYAVARADEPNMTLPDDAGVCIACGLPWSLHGCPPRETWEPIDDLAIDSVPLLQARAVEVASAIALMSWSKHGMVCSVCQRIGLVRTTDRVCARCAGETDLDATGRPRQNRPKP